MWKIEMYTHNVIITVCTFYVLVKVISIKYRYILKLTYTLHYFHLKSLLPKNRIGLPLTSELGDWCTIGL